MFGRASTYSAAEAADIDVRVGTEGRSAAVRFVNGPVTVGSLLAALEASGDFDARFSASAGCDATAANALEPSTAPADRDNTAGFADAAGADADAGFGVTQFAIEVRFGGCIASHVDAPLPEGVLARTIARNRNSEAADTQTELLRLLGGDGAGTGVLVGGAAGRTVRYEMATASVALMPMDRDRVLVAAGAQALGDDPSTDETESDFRPSAAHVAVGCASDVNTTTARARVDQNNNGGSDLRISQTGTIKARNQRTGPTRAPAVRTALLPNGEGRQRRSPGVSAPGLPRDRGSACSSVLCRA